MDSTNRLWVVKVRNNLHSPVAAFTYVPASPVFRDQQITFDASARTVTAQTVASCGCGITDTWYFRGTPNSWAPTAMTAVAGTSRHTITASFAHEDPAPRFKIDHRGDWTESYPAQDVIVGDCATYDIVFDSATKQVTTTKTGDVTTGACEVTSPPPPPPPLSGADFREETIITYDAQTHEIKLTEEAFDRISQLDVSTGGESFIVCVDKAPIYWGAFWTYASSMSFDGVTILTEPLMLEETHAIRLELGYPSSSFYGGEDPRNIRRYCSLWRRLAS